MKEKKLMEGQVFYILATIVLIMGIVFAIICDFFHLEFPVSAPCVLNNQFHLYCPGCGGTRAMFALMRFDILDSIRSNPIFLYLVLLFFYYYIGTTLAVWKHGRKIYFHPGMWMIWAGVVLLCYTLLVRNVLAVQFGIDYLNDVAPYWGRI